MRNTRSDCFLVVKGRGKTIYGVGGNGCDAAVTEDAHRIVRAAAKCLPDRNARGNCRHVELDSV